MASFQFVRSVTLVCGIILLAACDSFDKREASLQIREQFCRDWPYGCTDSARVVIEKVQKTPNGRQVEFRVVDRDDRTATLTAAYFEARGDDWKFLLFENPFNENFKAQASQFAVDSRRFTDLLLELNAAQKWFESIYGHYAKDFQELNKVSYRKPDLPIRMEMTDGGWKAVIANETVSCELDVSRQVLPRCTGVTPESAGTRSGPLSRTFGESD